VGGRMRKKKKFFVGFWRNGRTVRIYVTSSKKLASKFSKITSWSAERPWIYKKYGLYDYVILSKKDELHFDITKTYKVDNAVKLLASFSTINEQKILRKLEELIADVKEYLREKEEEAKERQEIRNSVLLIKYDTPPVANSEQAEYVLGRIRADGKWLNENVIYYKSKRRHIFYHEDSSVALFIPLRITDETQEQLIQVLKEAELNKNVVLDLLTAMGKVRELEAPVATAMSYVLLDLI
jgi:hypothetical protein